MAQIEVRHLSKTFTSKDAKVKALKDINLEIERGDIYGIIGMSGAGKSTLVRCLNYLEKPTKGEVLIDGRDLGGMTEKELLKQRKDIAMIFQHFNLLMQKNVVDNELAYPAQLSGGQKQRVAIARALASDPRILLCDEATSALDPQTTASILELLRDINMRFGITIVIITHQMSVIRKICSHVAIMASGEIKEYGLVDEIFSHPKTREARELILKDVDGEGAARPAKPQDRLMEAKKIRIVFSENSSFEPVIANMVLKTGRPVNILRADTKNVGGIAKGEMILGLPDDQKLQKEIEDYIRERGLEIEEVTGEV